MTAFDHSLRWVCSGLVLALGAWPAAADDAKADKSGYSLFNPTPQDQMRDFSPDRPGKAHGTITMDAGHVQLEADLITAHFDNDNGVKSRGFSAPVPVLRVGLTDRVELQLSSAFFNEEWEKVAGEASTSARGFGDTVITSKISLFGNEGGGQAMVLVPAIKLPTADDDLGNGEVEYAFNAAYSRSLPNDWSMTIDPGFQVVRNDDNTDYYVSYNVAANVSHEVLVKGMTLVLELSAEFADEEGVHTAYTFDPSLQYVICPNVQLDVGAYIGLNKAADDFTPYTGIAMRF